jgi:4-hydroxy-2-oxoheptanedioate aldolase
LGRISSVDAFLILKQLTLERLRQKGEVHASRRTLSESAPLRSFDRLIMGHNRRCIMGIQGMKQRLRAGEVLAGYVNVIPSAVSVQAMAAAGADWIIIDQEHGAVGPESLHAMIAATAGTRCSPLVRVPKRDEAWVKSALDLGAEGICFPLVGTAEEAAHSVSLVRYPPLGCRGWGPFIAHARWGTTLFDYLPKRGSETVCMLLIETLAAVENIDKICRVEGVDCIIIAPFDLSTALGVSGRLDAPEFVQAVEKLERAILAAGIPLGGAALTREQTHALLARGYTVPVQGFDVLMLAGLVRQTKEWRDTAPMRLRN